MSTKKILLLSLTILTLPLILILQPLTNEVNNTDKINKIVTNLYQCYDLPVEKRESCSLLNLNTNLSLADNLMLIKKIDNDIIKIKINEVVKQLNNVKPSSNVKDNQIMVLLLSYELLKEIKNKL